MADTTHILRTVFLRAIGEARANGKSGRTALMEAAMSALHRRYPVLAAQEADARRLFETWGGPLWDLQAVVRPALPQDIPSLIRLAVERHGAHCLWEYPTVDILRDPFEWAAEVAEALRAAGGPDPHPFWIAEALDQAIGPRPS